MSPNRLEVRGVYIDGGYREYIAVPAGDRYLPPDGLSDVDAVMIKPTTIANTISIPLSGVEIKIFA